jgi:hypothetical protein
MASSGSVNFSLTRDNIIQASLEDLLIMAAGDTTSSTSFTDHSTMMARKLNMLVKQWMGKADFAPGLKTWTNKRAYLFLQKGEGVYTLGPTATATGATNKWASSYWTTTIGTSGEASGQTVITLTDGSVVTTSDRIGIVLNTGYILHALRRDTDNIDTPIDSMQLEGYERVVKKTNEADPNYYYYEAQLTDGVIYFDSEISDCTDVIRIVYASPTEDFDAAADDADYPQEWLRPLALGLSVEACGNFQQEERAAYFKTLRDEALAIARHTTPENSDLYFMPGEAG